MLMVLAFVLMLCLTVLGFYLVRDVFSPMFLQPAVWALVIGMFFLVQPPYFPIRTTFPTAVMVWSVCFCLASYATYYAVPAERGMFTDGRAFMMDRGKPSDKLMLAFLVLSAITIPLMLFILIKTAVDRGDEHIMLFLRVSVVDDSLERPEFGIMNYAMPVPLILLLLVLVYGKNKWYVGAALLLNFMVAALTMAKTGFLVTLIALIYILYAKGKIKVKSIAIAFLLFLLFSIYFQYSRSTSMDEDAFFSVSDFISLYTLAPMVTFDYHVDPCSSTMFGENVFRFYYAVAHSLFGGPPPAENILPFVGIPEWCNTYTILYPFYKDFGLPGVGIFGALYGIFFTFLYKRAAAGHHYYQVLYGCFVSYLVVQFIQENIFSNLSLNIQYVLLTLAAYCFVEDKKPAEPKLPQATGSA